MWLRPAPGEPNPRRPVKAWADATGPRCGWGREGKGGMAWSMKTARPSGGSSVTAGAPSEGRRATVVLDTRVVCGTGGGPDKTILNSPRFLAPHGYRMLCAYMHPPGDPGFEELRRKARAWGAPLIALPDRGPWEWTLPGELLRICRRERVAI